MARRNGEELAYPSYGIKMRQAAFGDLSMPALLFLLSTPHYAYKRPKKSAPEGTVRAGGHGPPSFTLISPTPEQPSITFLSLFFLGEVYH